MRAARSVEFVVTDEGVLVVIPREGGEVDTQVMTLEEYGRLRAALERCGLMFEG